MPLVNQAQKFNVGRKIHRYLASLSTYTNTVGFQYQIAKVSFVVKEVNISDDTVLNTNSLTDVKFIAGPKPKNLVNNIALLLKNFTVEKVAKDSFVNTPFLLAPGNFTIETYKNDTLINTTDVTTTADNAVYLHQINIDNHNPEIADVFKVKLKNNVIYREVVVDADIGKNTMLVFLDAYKLPRSFTCFGEFTYPVKYNQISHNYKVNLEEVLEVVTTEKIKTFTLNTGSLFKENAKIVDELKDSKKAFVVKDGATVLELAPIANKLTIENSAEENYSYDLEFQINKENA